MSRKNATTTTTATVTASHIISPCTILAQDRYESMCDDMTRGTKRKITNAIKKGDLHELQKITAKLKLQQSLAFVDENPLALCLSSPSSSMDIFKYLVFLYKTHALWIPHNNEILYSVLDKKAPTFVQENRVSILRMLLDQLHVPVLPDPQILSKQIKKLPQSIRNEITQVAHSYDFAHQLTKAYAFEHKGEFQKMVRNHPNGLAQLPQRYPRFISMAVMSRKPDWVKLLLEYTDQQPLELIDYHDAFASPRNKEVIFLLNDPKVRPTTVTSDVIKAIRSKKRQLNMNSISWRTQIGVEVPCSVSMLGI